MKRMKKEQFEDILSKLPVGGLWQLQTMTHHGEPGGGLSIERMDDGSVEVNGKTCFPYELTDTDAWVLPYIENQLKLWPRGGAPAFARTEEQQQRREEKREQRNERREQKVKNGRIAGMKQFVMAGITRTSTEQDIERRVCEWLENSGLKPYDNSITPGFCKGHWVSEHKMDIYKDEWEDLPQEHVIVEYRRYGIGNKAMFYDVESVYFNTLTKEQEREARIWGDVCDGIVGKTYK